MCLFNIQVNNKHINYIKKAAIYLKWGISNLFINKQNNIFGNNLKFMIVGICRYKILRCMNF